MQLGLLYQAQEESGRYASEADLPASALGAPSQLTIFSWLVTEQTLSLLPSHPRITPKSKPRARSSLQALSLLGASLRNRKALEMPLGGEQAVTERQTEIWAPKGVERAVFLNPCRHLI